MSTGIQHLDADNFFEAMTGEQLLIVCFSSSRNQICKDFEEVLALAANNYPDVRFTIVDSDSAPSLAKEFNIQLLPSVMAFRESVILFSQHGTLSLAEIEDLADKAKHFDMTEVREERQKQYE